MRWTFWRAESKPSTHTPKRLSRRQKKEKRWSDDEKQEQEQIKCGTYGIERAKGSYYWYADNAKAARRGYRLSELAIVLVSTAVPILGILDPGNAKPSAALGAAVVALVGLRAIFHWHENWNRFSIAAAEINAQVRLYNAWANPYDVEETRQATIVERLNEIETRETSEWTTLAAPGAPPTPQSAPSRSVNEVAPR